MMARGTGRGARGARREARGAGREARGTGRLPALAVPLLLVVGIAALALIVMRRGREGDSGSAMAALPSPRIAFADTTTITSSDFLGSAACAECHRAAFAQWSASTHAQAGGRPGDVTVVAPFNGVPIRFRDAVVVPQARGGVYTFVVRQEGRQPHTFRVDGIVGGGHMEGGGTQGFVSLFPDGTLRFLPFDFARSQGVWFCNSATRADKGWIPITPDLALADCGDWPPSRILGDNPRFTNCQSCHGSQITVSLDTTARRYQTSFSSLGINCESCHGPGRLHVERVRDPQAVASGDIAMESLATLGKDGSLGICWQCHALKDQLRDGYVAGKPLEQHYSTRLPQLGGEAHLPDGRVRTFAYQQGHLYSACYVAGGMTCTSCHDPHSQRYRDVQGRPLAGRFDDRQCTACHPSKAGNPTAHTKHAVGSPGSRCVACHMPYLQEPETGSAIRYARSDHAIPIPRPAADSASGVRSACVLCHADRSEASLDAQMAAWYGVLKPRDDAITRVMTGSADADAARAASNLLLPGASHTAAVFAGLARFADQHLSPDMPSLDGAAERSLQRLATENDIDVRALALAALHFARGNAPAVRRFLAAQLDSMGADEPLVRMRWAVALGYFADKLRAAGDAPAAVATYRKAAEVDPANPRVHLNLGVALAEARAYADAVAAYQRSLALDPRQPLARVNLGIALAAEGDDAGAMREYRRALSLNAHEALAHFNLANVYLEAGNTDSAIVGYQRAIASDPSLPLPRFLLARIFARRGELARALEQVNAGLEFDPGNAEALSAKAQLTRALGGR